jgi:ABC-2 type transport system permease protein
MAKQNGTVLEKDLPAQEQSALAGLPGSVTRRQTLRNIGLIAGYEFTRRIRQRSFMIATILLLILVALGACVPTVVAYFTARSTSQAKMVVVNNAGLIAGMSNEMLLHSIDATLNGTAGQASGNTPYAIRMAPADSSPASLQQQVKEGTLSLVLVIDRAPNGQIDFSYYTKTSTSGLNGDSHIVQVQAMAGQLAALDKASRLGLTPIQTSHLFAQPDFRVVNTGQEPQARSVAETVTGLILGYVGVILIFMSVYLYGYWVATGVAEEKGSRIMEILVNAATPFQLMVGKIVGIGSAGLAQMTAFVMVGIGALLLQTPLKSVLLGSSTGGVNLDITGSSITLLLLLLVYFLLGFLLYASIFAAIGALVKRQEEIQNAVQLPMWLLLAGYLVSFFGIYTPDAPWVKVISYIPFWTPTTMLMRVSNSTVAWWEIALTIALMLAAIYICAVLAARIYRFGVLMYGQKASLRQLARLLLP